MKQLQIASLVLFIFFGSSCANKEIDFENVRFNENKKIWVDNSGSAISGKVVDSYISKKGNRLINGEFDVKDGKIHGDSIGYDLDKGVINEKKSFKMGLLEGLWYKLEWPSRDTLFKTYYTNGVRNGKDIMYYNGTIRRIRHFKNGLIVQSDSFRDDGKLYRSPVSKIQIVNIKTGFRASINRNADEIIWPPIIILKVKNVSDEPLDESIEVTAQFLLNGQEYGSGIGLIQSSFEPALQPGTSRQTHIGCSTGATNPEMIYARDIDYILFVAGKEVQRGAISKVEMQANRINY